MDKVILKNVRADLAVGLDAWRRPAKPQPVTITLEVQPSTSFETAAAQDDVGQTLDYGQLFKTITSGLKERATYDSVHELADHLCGMVPEYASLDIDISLPKAYLQVQGGVQYRFEIDHAPGRRLATSSLRATIRQITCSCIIGVNAHERLYKQALSIDVSVPLMLPPTQLDPEPDRAALHGMVEEIIERVGGSSYYTVEALATAVAQIVTVNHRHTVAIVRVEKPSAIASIDAAAVEVTRSKTFFENKDFWKVKLP